MYFSPTAILHMKRALSITLCAAFSMPVVFGPTQVQARKAYSTVEANVKDTFEVAPYSGGRKAGPQFDWGRLVKIEADETLRNKVMKEAAEGRAEAAFELGCMYLYGKGVERNPAKAFEQFRYASQKGHSGAQNNLAFLYDEGTGVVKDPKQAYIWYRCSADANNSYALANLGYMYEHGVATIANRKESVHLYKKAAELGNQTARKNLLMMEFLASKSSSSAAANSGSTQTFSPKEEAKQPENKVVAVAAPTKPVVLEEKSKSDSQSVKEEAGAEEVASSVHKSETEVKPNQIEDKGETVDIEESGAASPQVAEVPEKSGSALERLLKEQADSKAKLPADKKEESASEVALNDTGDSVDVTNNGDGQNSEAADKKDGSEAPVEVAESKKADAVEESAAKVSEKEVVAVKPVEASTEPESDSKIVTGKESGQESGQKSEKRSESKSEEIAASTDEPQESVAIASEPAAKVEEKSDKAPEPVQVATVPIKEVKEEVVEKKAPEVIESRRPIRDKWALIVGITDFQNPDVPNLQYSSKDATDFYNYLVKEANFNPDHVRILLNEKATQRRVLSELGSKFLARVVKPDDLVVLYFSTHGSPSSLDARGRNYLVAYDSDPSDLFATGIEMQKLLESIQGRVLTDRVLLVLDACHSGFVDPNSKGISRVANFNVNELVQGSGQLVICSSAPDQRAWESTRYKNGVFTKRLLEGLRHNGPKTPLQEAFQYTQSKVGDEVREDRPGAKQTPVLKGKWSGKDLIVSLPPQAPQAVPASVVSSLGPDSRVDLIAAKPMSSQSKALIEPDEDNTRTPLINKTPAAKHEVVFLDSQYFSLKGDPERMVRQYHDAIRNNPSDSSLYFRKAKALIQLGDWHNALICLNDALQLSPNRPTYYLGRAYVYCRQGKRVLAEQDLEQARFYDPRLGDVRLPD